MYNIIQKKRDRKPLSQDEIYRFIKGYTAGEIPDYQASALLMAIYFNGMNMEEISHLTIAMAESGDTVNLESFGSLSADKHSTGGVGDKTSPVVMSIAAALGCKCLKMSGRSLGHTGGTADKLCAIPGYEITLLPEKVFKQTEEIGLALVSQSGNLAPADKKLYALRDVTATVESIPLIASSIMSKKIAGGAKNIVLDVKVGSGAFMKDIESARALSECMVKIGKAAKRNVRAVITNMDVPLGKAVGNTLEVIEATELLKGNGDKELLHICCVLASHMVSMATGVSVEEALSMAYGTINGGRAYDKFCEWIQAQGGDVRYLEDTSLFEKASMEKEVRATSEGYIEYMDTQKIGNICVDLGGGRKTREDTIDYAAGITVEKKTGDYVKKGDVIAKVYTNDEKAVKKAEEDYMEAIKIGISKPEAVPVILETIQGDV